MQLRARLQVALEMQKSFVTVIFGRDGDIDCCRWSLSYSWLEDKYHYDNDNLWAESTYVQAGGSVYTVDQHLARYGYLHPLKCYYDCR